MQYFQISSYREKGRARERVGVLVRRKTFRIFVCFVVVVIIIINRDNLLILMTSLLVFLELYIAI